MLVPVYSVAKVFTAAAALRTFDAGARIGDLADVPDRLGDLVLGDLLAHRAGLGDYGGWPDYTAAVDAREPAWPDAAILDRVTRGAPGAFAYSNPGYLLVRLALESAYDAPLVEVLRRTVLDEVGVTAQAFTGLGRYDPRWVYPGTFVADPDEVGRGLAALLRTETGAEMLATLPVRAPGHPFAEPGYGLGLMTDGRPPGLAGHGGAGPGFTLFALARVDGSAAHVEVVTDEVDDAALIAACRVALA